MPEDTTLLKAFAQTQAKHIKLISDLSDNLDFLRSKYGVSSFIYQKTKHRLERAECLYKAYENVFDGYLYHTTQLQTHLKVFQKLYQNVSKHSKGENTATASTKTTEKTGRGERTAQPFRIGNAKK